MLNGNISHAVNKYSFFPLRIEISFLRKSLQTTFLCDQKWIKETKFKTYVFCTIEILSLFGSITYLRCRPVSSVIGGDHDAETTMAMLFTTTTTTTNTTTTTTNTTTTATSTKYVRIIIQLSHPMTIDNKKIIV